MNKAIISALLFITILFSPLNSDAGVNETAAQKILDAAQPALTGYGIPKVEKVTINQKTKTIIVKCNTATSYMPLNTAQVDELKSAIGKAMGSKYGKYKILVMADGHELSELATDSKRTYKLPKETKHFVTPLQGARPTMGLDGNNIALWQSHGWYFEPKLNRWEWQRARIFETVEDLYTQSYVMPFLMPMLENAGAYVMSPRERDTRVQEIIVDNDGTYSGYDERNGSKKWSNTDKPGFGDKGQLLVNGQNPFRSGTARMAQGVAEGGKASKATWNANIPESGYYAVYVSYQSLPNSATDAVYTVNAANGPHRYRVNQRMGGGTWIYLGHFPLQAGESDLPIVELSNETSDRGAVVTADAVKIGGGMGNIARIVEEGDPEVEYEYVSSGYPRFTEGSRYWLQWAGAPDSVYNRSNGTNDYTDDYTSRPYWVNWLAGGSSVLPKREGLNIPIDLSLAFHSDAGTTSNDSIIGTLGIYCTNNTEKYANGTDRMAARNLTNLIMTNIVDDVRASFEPQWTRRGMWDRSYAEARVPEVPTMLLELLSHQNFADMKYGLDPAFRFVVSRAVYKGMLQFLAERDGRPYVVQPLPVRSFSIAGGADGRYTLSWAETVDSLESTATPSYYVVEERVGDAVGFTPIATVIEPNYEVTVTDSRVHSYRVIAGNEGGVSFPSEVLALGYKPGAKQVLVVNSFTRVSAPDWFDAGEIAGFYNERDGGVPYIEDISFIGSMYEFRREIPWMDDDAAGFGASRSDYETQVVAGNTFDYAAIHGESILEAGYGFISSSVEAFTASNTANQPMIVDLIMGKQKEIKRGRGVTGTFFKTFPAALQDKLRAYTQAGGNVMVTGSFIATDLWDNLNTDNEIAEADQKFAKEVLGYTWRTGMASVTGEAHEVQSRYKQFGHGNFRFSNVLNQDMYAVESPDAIFPSDTKTGATIMRYTENNLPAGTVYAPGKYRAVCIGFPFETIRTSEERNHLMKQVLDFFSK